MTKQLDENTKVPLRLTIICVTAFVGGALWLTERLHRIEERLIKIEMAIGAAHPAPKGTASIK